MVKKLLVLLAAIAASAPVCAAETVQCARFSREELPAPVPSPYPSAVERLEQINRAVKSTSYSVLFLGDSLTEGWDATVWDRNLASRGALNAGVRGIVPTTFYGGCNTAISPARSQKQWCC